MPGKQDRPTVGLGEGEASQFLENTFNFALLGAQVESDIICTVHLWKQKGLTAARDQPGVLATLSPTCPYSIVGGTEQCHAIALLCT